ncbi:MAG: response regulator transcription factor [Lachnospiraceae bacterium]|nr:response regulator transcription factor [Lachnospiraceae bacterium]
MNEVLIVEDDKLLANLEKDYMEMSGFSVTIVGDGITGERMVLEGDYNIMLLDVMIPGKDGFEVLKRVRSEKLIPIVMVTSRSDEADKVRALSMGADDYITKPFSPVELMARVRAIMERERRIRSLVMKGNTEVIRRRDLVIDCSSKRVWVGDTEAKLTGKEFELLSFMASNPGRVYSKEELFDMVWHENAYGDITTISVHVRRIRIKLSECGFTGDCIETVWGVGYRFISA